MRRRLNEKIYVVGYEDEKGEERATRVKANSASEAQRIFKDQMEANGEDYKILGAYLDSNADDEDVNEMNVTSNLDGGAGPVKTPYAFKKKRKRDMDETFEVDNFFRNKILSKLRNAHYIINECGCDKENGSVETGGEDDSKSAINTMVREANATLYEIERKLKRIAKLKTEHGSNSNIFLSKNRRRLQKMRERIVKIESLLRELSK